MAVADKVVMPLAREMLACFDQEIHKVENPPMYVGLRPGNVVAHLMSTAQGPAGHVLPDRRRCLSGPGRGADQRRDPGLGCHAGAGRGPVRTDSGR
jgi:hypothetical protein